MQVLRKHRYSNTTALRLRAHRYSTPRGVNASRQHRYRALPGEVLFQGEAVSAYDLAWRYGMGEWVPSFRVWSNGTIKDLGDAPATFRVTHSESGATSWELTIRDTTGYYHPRKVGGEWEGWMDRRAYLSGGAYGKKLLYECTWGGAEYKLVGIPTAYGHKRSGPGPIGFSWSGVDVSHRLFRGGQTLETQRAVRTLGSTPTNRTVLDYICSAAGVPCDWSKLEVVPIPLMHMQDGSFADWLQQVLEVTMSEMRIVGGVLEGYQPRIKSVPDWTYDVDALVPEDSLDEGDQGPNINKVTVRRGVEAGGTVTPKDGQSPEVELLAFGQYTVEFDPPVHGLSWRMLESNPLAIASDFYLYSTTSGDSRPAAVREPRVNTSQPNGLLFNGALNNITRCVFTWGERTANFGAITEAPGLIEFTGSQGFNPELYGSAMDTDLVVVRVNQSSIDSEGEWPIELPPNPLIATRAIAERHGDRYLARASRGATSTKKVELNTLMQVGDTELELDPALGTSTYRMIIEVEHNFSNDAVERYTTFKSVEYGRPDLLR